MNIGCICISHKRISSGATGGIETLTICLLSELVKLGCQVSIFAAEETDPASLPGVRIIPIFSLADLEKSDHEDTQTKGFTLNYALLQYSAVASAYLQRNSFDLLHISCAQWYIPFLFADKSFPVVTTIHVNDLRPRIQARLLQHFSGVHLAMISTYMSQAFSSYPLTRMIHNGIALESFAFVEKPKDYFAWLGRIAPVKGLREAVIAAKQADVPLLASGSIDFPEYFATIQPLLDRKRTVLPACTIAEKSSFLGNARAVLMPVQWDEPFGLVAIEAMACGTPVIAFRRGGLQEIIVDGVTGFLVNTVEEMAEKIKQVDRLNRQACRNHVAKHFSASAMAKNYLNYYNSIVQN